jgi:glyoxylase-like metal-dependent hydrolase (beta-lactamase superfamily II)
MTMPAEPSDRSYTFHPIRLPNVSVFLIHTGEGAMLVDSGNRGSESRILKEMKNLGLEPGMLSLLVLTHAHFDHAGSAARLREVTGCRIMVHRSEEDRMREGFTGLPPGTRWKARVLVGLGRTFARRLGKFPPAVPDLLVDGEADLADYGFPGKVIHAPGHTPGSMVVLMEGGELVAGDTLFGVEGKQHFPPYAEDLPSLVESWKAIREWKVKRAYPAHGHDFPWESFLAEFGGAMERYEGKS